MTGDGRVLVDSSVWIELLRGKGDESVRSNLRSLLLGRRALWCPVIRVELWQGVGSSGDRKMLENLEQVLESLDISKAVWDRTCELSQLCCQKGRPVPVTDVIIFACAEIHGVELLHRDRHMDALMEMVQAKNTER